MADIGAMLREARMRERLDIAEFESRTKIRAKYLRALEDEEWALLPGYTFTKAFLRTYADMLGLDGRMLVDEFKRQYKDPSELDLAPVLPSRREARRSRDRSPAPRTRERSGERSDRPRERARRPAKPPSRVVLAGVLVLAIAAALLAIGLLHNGGGKTHTTSSSTTHSRTTHSRTHTAPPVVKRVALKLIATTPVQVCLIGYKTAHSPGLQRLNASIGAHSHTPTYHADNRFLVSFTGGSLHMLINAHSVAVTATATTVVYEVFVSGHRRVLTASQAPHCK
jgi:cytoskeleton protein RodZ